MLLSGGPPTPQGHPLADYHYAGNQSTACSFTDRCCSPLHRHVQPLTLKQGKAAQGLVFSWGWGKQQHLVLQLDLFPMLFSLGNTRSCLHCFLREQTCTQLNDGWHRFPFQGHRDLPQVAGGIHLPAAFYRQTLIDGHLRRRSPSKRLCTPMARISISSRSR